MNTLPEKKTYFSVQKEYIKSSSDKENTYYYSYSYLYNWIKIEENDDLLHQFDNYFFLKLTTLFFEICLPNKHRKFERKTIKAITLKKKKLILPLLVGGIIGPLSLVAANIGNISLFTGLSLFLGSSLLFYFGFIGNYQLQIKFINGTENQFFIDMESVDLQYFIHKVNTEVVVGNHVNSRINI